VGVAEKRRLCRAYADKYIDIQRREFKRLGVLGDWENPYATMSYDYEGTIVRELGRFVGAGSVYKGLKPVHWCMNCRTALAEAEVEYENHSSPSIWVKFALPAGAERIDPALAAEFWMLDLATPSAESEQGHLAQRLPLEVSSPDGGPQLSPDGRWLAYASDDESGRRQVYMQPHPGPGGKWQISTDGGNEPQWNPNGRELFYRNGDEMMVVDISAEAGMTVGKPRRLFAGRYARTSSGWVRPNYDVSPDGQQFLMLKPMEQEEAPLTQISVVLNWSEELKRLVPTE